jgi:3-phenylpropionate/cinnamic acid dioxygenase small subunit
MAGHLTSAEAAVARAGAELEIRNLLALLAHLADAGDVPGYLALLTEDVVWAMPTNAAIGLPASERRGHDAVGAGQRERIAAGHQGEGSNTLHMVTTTAVAVEGTTATAHSYFQYWVNTATEPRIANVGRYEDELRRTPGGWRLARRTIHFG